MDTDPIAALGVLAWAKRTFVGVLSLVVILGAATEGRAEVFHSKESALHLAFPEVDRVESRNLFLTQQQRSAVERRAGSQLPSRMVTCYVGWRVGQVVGYAFFDTHLVRTMAETSMVVLDPGGAVRGVHILAFHEPSEYMPSRRWLAQFARQRLSPALAVDQDIDVIAGASLSSGALTAGVRRSLALYEILLREPS